MANDSVVATAYTETSGGARPPTQLRLLWPEDQRLRDTSTQWVVQYLLRRGAVGCVYGVPGAFKSFLMLDVAVSVANGCGEFLGYPVENGGPVLIIAADDGVDTTVDRLRWIAEFRLGHSEYDNVALTDRGAFSLQHPAARQQLEHALMACKFKFHAFPALVVVDTAAMAGAPTADYGYIYPEKLGWLKEVASEFECCIVLVDHEAKPTADRSRQDVRIGMWGSMMKAGFFEFALSMRKVEGAGDTRVELETSDKRTPVRLRLQLEFRGDEGSYSLESSGGAGASVDDVIEATIREKGPQAVEQLVNTTGSGKDTVRRAKDRLLKEGRLTVARPARGRTPALYAVLEGRDLDVDDLPA